MNLVIAPSCVNVIEEMQGFQWKQSGNEEVEPNKGDHLCDIWRYWFFPPQSVTASSDSYSGMAS